MARKAYKTWSTAWYTPLLATKSNLTTKALPALEVICTNFPLLALSSSPEAVLSLVAPWGMALPASLVPGTTWRRRTAFRAFLSSRSLLRESTGTLSKAELVGAKSVKGPAPSRVSRRSAAFRAVKRVEKCSFPSSSAFSVFPDVRTTGFLIGACGIVLMLGLGCWC